MDIRVKLTKKIADMEIDTDLKSVLLSSPLKFDTAFDLFIADTFSVFVQVLKSGKTYSEAKEIVKNLYEPFDIRPQFQAKNRLLVCQKLTKNATFSVEMIDNIIKLPIEQVQSLRHYKYEFRKLNVESVGDLLTLELSALTPYVKNNESFRLQLRDFLKLIGYNVNIIGGAPHIRMRDAIIGNSEKLDNQEIDKILTLPIEVVCTSDEYVENLKSLGINTIGDLQNKASFSEIVKAFKVNKSSINLIREILRKCDKEVGAKLNSWVFYTSAPNNVSGKEMFYSMSDEDKLSFLNSSIRNIQITEASKAGLENNGIMTIADLLKSTPFEIKDAISNNTYAYVSILNYLRGYGICTKHDKRKTDQTNRVFDVKSASQEEQDEFYSRPIESLNITKPAIKKLKEVGHVETIGDLLQLDKITVTKILNRNASAKKILKSELEKYGLEIKNYDPTDPKNIYTERTVPILPVSELKDEEKEKYLQSHVSELGLKKQLVRALEKEGITTIKDLTTINPKKVAKSPINRGNNLKEIREFLDAIGLSYTYYYARGKSDVVVTPEDVKKMNEFEKLEFMERSISDIGISNIIVEKLGEIGIHKLSDIMEMEKNDIRKASGLRNDRIQELEKRLFEYGIFMPGSVKENLDEIITYTERKIEPIDIMAQEEDLKNELLDREISEMGVPDYLLPKLQRKDIITIRDLENLSLRTLRNLLRKTDKINEVLDIFASFGIKISDANKINFGSAQSSSGRDKYYARQMEHLNLAIPYIKARNKKHIFDDTKDLNF